MEVSCNGIRERSAEQSELKKVKAGVYLTFLSLWKVRILMRSFDVSAAMEIKGTITNSDAMYCYFEMIKKLGAGSVLDIGMFLKRIGAVSRQMAGTQVNKDVFLYGIDFFPEIYLPIYQVIYDKIISFDHFKNYILDTEAAKGKTDGIIVSKFDLVVMLETEDLIYEADKRKLVEYLMQYTSAILADQKTGKWMTDMRLVKGYYPIQIDSSRFAWIPVEGCSIKK